MNIRQILPALAGIAVLCGPVRADIAPYLPPPHDFRRAETVKPDQIEFKLGGETVRPADFVRSRSLNGEWRFSGVTNSATPFPADADLNTGFMKPEFDASGWSTIRVPLDWFVKYPQARKESEPYTKGLYRTEFELTPAELENRRVILKFDCVGYDAKVFLNGVEVGNHHGDFTPFKLDVTGAAKAGKNVLAVRVFSDNGPINTWLLQQGWYVDGVSKALGMGRYVGEDWVATAFPFLVTKTGSASRADLPYSGTNPFVLAFTQAFWPKLTIVLINIWVGIPYTMLSTSGILMNIPDDLYESSQIDGANKWRQFWSITMPYVLFVTGPSLLTTFIGNINNFNVIFFLTDGGYNHGGMLETSAGDTSLLITWIYNLSNATPPMYNTTSILGCIVFAICGFFSLIVYRRLGSVKNEEEFQ